MKRALTPVVVLALTIAGAGLLQGQRPSEKSDPARPARDPFGLGITRTQEQVRAMTVEVTGEPSTALQEVDRFLQLRPDQREELGQLLQMRRETLAPLLAGIMEREKRLRELLESGGSASDIGQAVIEIHTLRKRIAQVQEDFLADWENLLDPEQRQRLEAVRQAVRLQPIVPAFQQLQLL